MKSGNLNFLEPSGPLQACNETALPSPLAASKLFHHVWFEVVEAITMSVPDPITGNSKVN